MRRTALCAFNHPSYIQRLARSVTQTSAAALPYSRRNGLPSSSPRRAVMAELRSEEQEGGRGKGGRRGRGGKGGPRGEGREVLISKALSKLLRHAAEEEGLALDGEGFGRVDHVMSWPRLRSLNVTFADIRTAVTDNAKQRFSMKPNPSLTTPPALTSEDPADWVIRANQGHSIAMESAALLTPITLAAGNVPDVVVHGTFFAFYPAIVASGGLKPMSRNHVHFSTGLPEGKEVVSGMRGDAELLIYVDIRRSLADGVLWWVSENGVVLTEGDWDGLVSTKYWEKVVGRREDVGVLWEGGKQVGELPERFRDRKAPMGKGHRGGRRGRGGGGRGGG